MYIIFFNILFSLLYIIIGSKKNLHILQQNFYNENNRYIKWGNKNLNNVFKLDIIILLVNILNIFIKNKYILVINICYILLYFIEKNNINKEQVKIPLKVTSRVKRMIVTNIILLSNIINKPIEKCVFIYYKNKAINKIKSYKNLNVVGITGSYGKTSSKNILNDILNVKYNSMCTPKNYNTQYGLILTINNYLDKFNDVFIAEMGAFKRGRIKLLCNLVRPKYGIITSIGTAHLDTFGSRENIQKGKFELIESLPPDGLAILNMDDEYQVSYKIKNNVKVLWVGIENENADLYASNIKASKDGMSFDIYFKKENIKHTFNTILLGNSNVYNILEAVAFSRYVMNMSFEEIKLGVKRIKPITHRLEIKNMGDRTIIDDAYNSNPIGSKMALDVLKLMDGLKVVVTPGMIELGDEQYNLNKKFGEYISEVADYVILVGKKQTEPILDGLKEKQYKNDKIFLINDVKEAFDIIDKIKVKNKHSYILLENDLPDIFNEK